VPKILTSTSSPGRFARGHRVSSTLSEINIIPLVDVMLVLLIIFMIAAPMLQRGIEVNLPVASRSQEIASERVFVDVPVSFREDRRVYIAKEPLRIDVLAERMRQLMLNRTDKQVYLRLDGEVSVQELTDVLDRLKEGGVINVGVVTRLPGEQ
jgi:biopolymer transport protein ExbD